MNVALRRNKKRLNLTITGAIDHSTSAELDFAFQELCDSEPRSVGLDLRGVPTINSDGIGKLVELKRNLESGTRSLEITGISDNLYETFRLIKLDRLIPIRRNCR